MKIDQLVGAVPVDHLQGLGGMDYTTPPHLLDQQKWRLLYNTRTINGAVQQIARQRLYAQTTHTEEITALAALPTGAADCAAWLALSDTKLTQLASLEEAALGATSVVLSDSLTASGHRWGTYVHNGFLFFTNPNNRVRMTDGSRLVETWEGQHSEAVDSTVDPALFVASDDGPDYPAGPFTLEPFYTWDSLTEDYIPSGYLNTPTFTWTNGVRYRVYVARPRMFSAGMGVTVVRGLTALNGLVLNVYTNYIEVLATNTVPGITNARYEPTWRVFYTNVPDVPAGRYVTVFFDHLVVACVQGDPSLVKWSDLYNYARWRPGSDCEADSRKCTDYQRPDDISIGVTGVQHLGEQLVIFTPSCIYAMAYTGLPRVVRVAPLVTDYGNGLPYATAALHDRVVWYDAHRRSFFALSSQGPQDFGAPIATYFASRLNTQSNMAARTWSFVDRVNTEVGWVYCAGTSQVFNEAVVYNWANNTWSVREITQGMSSCGYLYRRARPVRELLSTIDALTGTCDQLEQTSAHAGLAFGNNAGAIYADVASTTALVDYIAQSAPVLETGDLLYGSVRKVKEVHTIAIQVGGTHSGVKVEVSVRDNLTDAVTYENVGTWTSTLPEKELTFRSRVGRVLRYRFTPLGSVRNFVFYGYTDNIMQANANR